MKKITQIFFGRWESDFNICLKKNMDENLSNFMQAQYTNLG